MSNLKFFQPQQLFQPADKRRRNFEEVCGGLNKRAVIEEARRCPQCNHAPCRTACPLGVDIPGFIRSLREGDAATALTHIKESNPFPEICGRVCMAPCEKACVLSEDGSPINIRSLERFAADKGEAKFLSGAKAVKPSGKKIAIIGSGVSGLTAAKILVRRNFSVVIYEALPFLGGVLRYGVPRFRLPHKILDKMIAELENMGVEFRRNNFVGRSLTIEDISNQGFAMVILAVGTGGAQLGNIAGANLEGVHYAEEILLNVNLSDEKELRQKPFAQQGKNTVVVGKDYAAMDCARVCARLGKSVTLVCDCPEEALEIYPQDVELAKEEGVMISAMTRCQEIIAVEGVRAGGVRCVTLDYADPGSTGKWELSAVPGTETVIDADTVILSLGHRQNTALPRAIPGLKANEDGTIWFTDKQATSLSGVLVAGDAATGTSSLVQAMASGKVIAGIVEQYLSEK